MHMRVQFIEVYIEADDVFLADKEEQEPEYEIDQKNKRGNLQRVQKRRDKIERQCPPFPVLVLADCKLIMLMRMSVFVAMIVVMCVMVMLVFFVCVLAVVITVVIAVAMHIGDLFRN